jgi:hypothetical protein
MAYRFIPYFIWYYLILLIKDRIKVNRSRMVGWRPKEPYTRYWGLRRRKRSQ